MYRLAQSSDIEAQNIQPTAACLDQNRAFGIFEYIQRMSVNWTLFQATLFLGALG